MAELDELADEWDDRVASGEEISWDEARAFVRRVAGKANEWAGVPLPVKEAPLVIEPRYPNAAKLMAITRSEDEESSGGNEIVNVFWSSRKRCDVMIWRTPEGELDWGLIPGANQVGHLIATLGASVVWGLEQERAALDLMAELVEHHKMLKYLMTGMFLERSHRSGLVYVFRKLRPTLAVSMHGKHPRILCALCLHPIAYYEGSWAGAMCPTDDVIAHLMLMRGDEHMFWKRASQHPPWRPEAGV